MTPTLTLIMIVKNEEKIIQRCLESVRKYVDYIVISDTGSTDQTPQLIDDFLSQHSIQGKVYRDEWKNFGHNRTKSLLNGQEWLTQNHIPLEQNYFLTIDADMLVKERNFKKEKLAEKESWMMLQETPSIKYYNMRIFRSDLNYRCIGVTHEYWGCTGKDPTEGRLEGLYIDDRGDGGCKADKFSRDITLLTNGLKDEPNNVRYYFYLAQSYADSNDIENALLWYKKRIDAGGWVEEIFISHLRRGELYEKKCDFGNAILEWLHAYQKLPTRSETLYRIVRHFRILGQNESAMVFLQTALSIPYPADCVLFIEHPVYQYKLIEELSIISYYIKKHKKLGKKACQYLLLNESVPLDVKEKALDNSYFYMEPLSDKITTAVKLNLPCPSPYQSSSSCLYIDKNDNKIKGVVRAVNYSMNDKFQYFIRDEKQIVRTENFWIEMDTHYNVSSFYKIETNFDNPLNSPKKRESHIRGFEDIRVCPIGQSIYGIAVCWEYGERNHPSVVYFVMNKNNEGKYVINRFKAIRYRDEQCQKNWTLYTENDNLYAIYSHYPVVILELDKNFEKDEQLFLQHHNPYDITRSRGSGNPIRISDTERLVCIHEVIFKDTRKYYHRFLKYDNNWNITGISQPFYFNQFYVEFTLSIMYLDGVVYIPLSTKDNTTEIIALNYADIEWFPIEQLDKGFLLE